MTMKRIREYIKKYYLSYISIGFDCSDNPVYIRKAKNALLVFSLSILLIVVLIVKELQEGKTWVMPVHALRIVALLGCIYLLYRKYYYASVRLGIYAIFISSIIGTCIAPVQNSFHFLSFSICALSFYFNNRRVENVVFFILCLFYFSVSQYYNNYHLPPDNSASYIISLVIIFFIFYLTTALFVSEYKFFQGLIMSKNQELESKNSDLELQNRELEKLNRFKNDSISIISHDLKSPVNGLVEMCYLLKKNFKNYTPEKFEQRIELLKYNSEKVNNMLIELLVWANSHSHAIEVQKKLVEVTDLCNNILVNNQFGASLKNVALSLQQYDSKYEVVSDPVIISIVVRNLIANAIKYSKSGGSIEIDIKKDDNAVLISVIDDGIGISENVIKLIEERAVLSSLPGTKAEIGHGIGLSICKDLCRLIDADFRLKRKSKEGGTIATLIIPFGSFL